MRRISPLALLSAVALAACAGEPAAPNLTGGPALSAAAAPRHVVKFAEKAVPADFAARVAALGGTVELAHAGAGLAIVAGLSADAAATLGAGAGIAAVIADHWMTLDQPEVVLDDAAVADAAASPSDPAAATRFPRQWHLRAIGAEKAWAAKRLGSPAVTVAILDTGIDYSHPDLVGRVDLSRSRSFLPSEDALVVANFPTKHLITDLHYHGTHVAATVSSNASLAAGVTSGVTLVGVKTLGLTGGPVTATIAGILYATDDARADVINMSLGGTNSRAGNGDLTSMIQETMNYAASRGVTVVVAAGNDAADLAHNTDAFRRYCDAATTFCVSATGPTAGGTVGPWVNVDAPAVYTNYGTGAISVAAPGGNTGGAVWAACSKTSLNQPVCQTGNFVLGLNGTSMASPHTAALAALLVERYGRSPAQIKARIMQTADDLGKSGADEYYGKGRINVPRALGLE
jgi:subtilisin family serine protease